MKKISLQEKGRLGEKIASDFLVRKGYKIIQSRFYTRQGEIDLVVLKDNSIIFVEVKTRTSNTFGSPEQSINQLKISKINKAISKFFAKYPKYRKYNPCFDIISIELRGKQAMIRHYENIMF